LSNVRSCSLCAVVRPERHWKLTQCLSSCRATRSPLPGVQGALCARLFASTFSKWWSHPGSETRFEFVAPSLWRRVCGAKPCGATNSALRTQRVFQTGGHSQPHSVEGHASPVAHSNCSGKMVVFRPTLAWMAQRPDSSPICSGREVRIGVQCVPTLYLQYVMIRDHSARTDRASFFFLGPLPSWPHDRSRTHFVCGSSVR